MSNSQSDNSYWGIGVVILLFAGIGIWYSVIVPPFETPDEPFHYAFARHVAQGNGLPVQRQEPNEPWSHEGSQAPLYYLLTGLATAGIDQDDFESIKVRNPRANMGNPLLPGNKNYSLYSSHPYPLQGANLALHIGRWISICLGIITIYFTWLTARLVLPTSRILPLLAAFLVATIPQFGFVSASFSNDNMVTAVSSATVYLLATMLVAATERDEGEDGDEPSPGQWLGVGMLLGLAALSKLNGLGLCLLVGMAAWLMAWHRRDWSLPWRGILPVAGPLLAIAGWWYWRNYTLYGDWLGITKLLDINGLRVGDVTVASLWDEFRGLRYSFWALFGWFNVPLPLWVYPLFDGLTVIGAVGCAGAAMRESRSSQPRLCRPLILLLLIWILIPLGLMLYWAQNATSSQGRLLFPAISAFAIVLTIGLDFWIRLLSVGHTWAARLLWALVFTLPVGSLAYTLILLIPQTYYPDKGVALAQATTIIPAHLTRLDATYGDATQRHPRFTLHAIDVSKERFRPGDRVPITLYISSQDSLDDDVQLFIQLLNEKGEQIANVTTHPGWGRNPTTFWEPGLVYEDEYAIRIDGPIDPSSPLMAQLYVGFINPKTEKSGRLPLPAFDKAGETFTPIYGDVTITPHRLPIIENSTADMVNFVNSRWGDGQGELIELSAFSFQPVLSKAAEHLEVQVLWKGLREAPREVSNDYIAYVQLLNAAGERVAGFDQPPARGRFPTSLWQPNDQILSTFLVPLPEDLQPERYEIWTGFYLAGSQGSERLPISDAAELAAAHNQLLLGTIHLEQ